MKDRRKQRLLIEIIDGVLNISIGVDILAHAITMGPAGTGNLKVLDADLFAQEIKQELSSEEEDGSTPLHRLLDRLAKEAIENGAEGVDYDEEI